MTTNLDINIAVEQIKLKSNKIIEQNNASLSRLNRLRRDYTVETFTTGTCGRFEARTDLVLLLPDLLGLVLPLQQEVGLHLHPLHLHARIRIMLVHSYPSSIRCPVF
jgi:hypothetical protein